MAISSDYLDTQRTSSAAGVRPSKVSDGVELAARLGYTAKGVVYAVIGGLAVQQAFGAGGETSGSRGALREIASQPFGTVLLAVVALGLAGYVIWRLVQAVADPEGAATQDSDGKRWAKRGFYLISALIYGLLTWYAVDILTGSGGSSSSDQQATSQLMSSSWGVWLVAIVGVGVAIRGIIQLYKAYTESFRKKIRSFDIVPGARKWVLRASRIGLTARGVVFGIIAVSLLRAAITHDPEDAEGLEGALDLLVTTPWLLGAAGVGLVCYAIYQWVKARYRIIGV